jgi:hypothetical protein
VDYSAKTLWLAMAILGSACGAARMQEAAAQGAEGPNPGELSQAQISACSEEIRRAQARWKYSPGGAVEAATRLGKTQKEMFEGRCAGHPQARAYVTTANRILEHASAARRATASPVSLPPASPPCKPGLC